MTNALPIWIARELERVGELLTSNRLPTGLYIGAAADFGQRRLGFAIARRVLGVAPASRAGTGVDEAAATGEIAHPDFREVGLADKTVITVDAIRAIGDYAQQTSMGTHKVILVDPADRMNRNAANALLKTLEEPAPGSLIILTGYGTPLLPTLLSRCQQVRLRVTDAELDAWLAERLADMPADRRALGIALYRHRPFELAAFDESDWQALESRLELLARGVTAEGASDGLLALADTRDAPGLVTLLWSVLALAIRMRSLGADVTVESERLRDVVVALSRRPPEWLHQRLAAAGVARIRLSGPTNPNPRLLLEALLVDWLDPPPRSGWPERTGGFNIFR